MIYDSSSNGSVDCSNIFNVHNVILSSLYRCQGRPMTAAIALISSLQHNTPGLYKIGYCQIVYDMPPNHI